MSYRRLKAKRAAADARVCKAKLQHEHERLKACNVIDDASRRCAQAKEDANKQFDEVKKSAFAVLDKAAHFLERTEQQQRDARDDEVLAYRALERPPSWDNMPASGPLSVISRWALKLGVADTFSQVCTAWRAAACSHVVQIPLDAERYELRSGVVLCANTCGDYDKRPASEGVVDASTGAILVSVRRNHHRDDHIRDACLDCADGDMKFLAVSPNGLVVSSYSRNTRTLRWMGTRRPENVLKSFEVPPECGSVFETSFAISDVIGCAAFDCEKEINNGVYGVQSRRITWVLVDGQPCIVNVNGWPFTSDGSPAPNYLMSSFESAPPTGYGPMTITQCRPAFVGADLHVRSRRYNPEANVRIEDSLVIFQTGEVRVVDESQRMDVVSMNMSIMYREGYVDAVSRPSPDGTLIATHRRGDADLRVWHRATQRVVHCYPLPSPEIHVCSMSFSHDGPRLRLHVLFQHTEPLYHRRAVWTIEMS